MIQPKRDDAIRKVYRKQGELVIEGPFRRIQDNELVLTGRVAVKNSDGSPWGLVAVTLDRIRQVRNMLCRTSILPHCRGRNIVIIYTR